MHRPELGSDAPVMRVSTGKRAEAAHTCCWERRGSKCPYGPAGHRQEGKLSITGRVSTC